MRVMAKYIYIICEIATRSFQPFHLDGCLEVAKQRGDYVGDPYEAAPAFTSKAKAIKWLNKDLEAWGKCSTFLEVASKAEEIKVDGYKRQYLYKAVVKYHNNDYCCREYTIVKMEIQ